MARNFYLSTQEIWDGITRDDRIIESRRDYEVGRLTVLLHDWDPTSPRGADNLGIMVCHYPRHDLGDEDEHGVIEALRTRPMPIVVRWLKAMVGATVVLPLYVYEHGGITIRAGGFSEPRGWDASFVGLIYDTPHTREMNGTPPELIEQVLRDEVKTYADFLEGVVYAYSVYDEEGNLVDSDGDIYGSLDDLRLEAGIKS